MNELIDCFPFPVFFVLQCVPSGTPPMSTYYYTHLFELLERQRIPPHKLWVDTQLGRSRSKHSYDQMMQLVGLESDRMLAVRVCAHSIRMRGESWSNECAYLVSRWEQLRAQVITDLGIQET